MERNYEQFDAIVIGAGHAGCEAALALSRTGNKTLLLTISLDAIAFLACNPSIGGTAKGQLVAEVDALGGEMGRVADKTALQIRMLNRGKGPAVQSLRVQADKNQYHSQMKKVLESEKNLFVRQGEVVSVEVEGTDKIVTTQLGLQYRANAVIFATGVYLKSEIIIGQNREYNGPNGFKNSSHLSESLEKLGIKLLRFKTGTPVRLHARSVDYRQMEVQLGDEDIMPFSTMTEEKVENKAVCYLTYTTPKTHEIIRKNLDKAPAISGEIKGIGPRYCPSIETKVVRFADKERHQLFLEPEAIDTQELYLQGFSTSMPAELQKEMVHSVIGLENAEIMRDAYAIEYDCIEPTQLKPTLELKTIDGLFFAGQINGTSGYEEAAAQGIVAGINASLYIKGQPQMVLKRNDGYIGVLIDDIVTKGTNEPYRMMTSRAEYRLLLRQDNADMRLTEIGRKVGLVDDLRWQKFLSKKEKMAEIEKILMQKVVVDEKLKKFFGENGEPIPKENQRFYDLMKRTNIDIFKIENAYNLFAGFDKQLLEIVNIKIKYEGYLKQQQEDIDKMLANESVAIPENFDYSSAQGLREEAKEKLAQIKPLNLGQASRISGVSPADVSVLSILVKKGKNEKFS
ncbi:MAG: tRNA uridine-5-carboxymethylaminomethyl(34) synthesis enzyme MnmG [Clostridia bacterium]|nr:tRNA uridine-5-carboxymethylaminomethyl(34) synthesis enzyme MnmG [Clostridia bacterium]